MRWSHDANQAPRLNADCDQGRAMTRAKVGTPADGGVYFEFTPVGASVKVAAIDAATGTEISVVGPARASQADLQRLALQKLKARLKAGR
jgi:hypothetical protein